MRNERNGVKRFCGGGARISIIGAALHRNDTLLFPNTISPNFPIFACLRISPCTPCCCCCSAAPPLRVAYSSAPFPRDLKRLDTSHQISILNKKKTPPTLTQMLHLQFGSASGCAEVRGYIRQVLPDKLRAGVQQCFAVELVECLAGGAAFCFGGED